MSGTKVGTRNENLKTQMDESLFDFIELCFPAGEEERREIRLQKHDYLEKGIRIENLAREKKRHKRSLVCYAQKELNIFRMKMRSGDKNFSFEQVLEKMERELKRMVSAAKTEEDFIENGLPNIKKALGIYGDDIEICPERGSKPEPGYGICRNKGSFMAVKLSAGCEGGELVRFCPIGGKGKVKKGFWHYRHCPEDNAFIGTFFDVVAAASAIGRLQEALWEQCDDASGRTYKLAEELLSDLFTYNFLIGDLTDEVFQNYLTERGYHLDYETMIYRKEGNNNVMDMDLVIGESMNLIHMEYLLLRCLREKQKLPLECIFQRRKNTRKGRDGLGLNDSYAVRQLLGRLYLLLYEEYVNYTVQEEYEQMLNKSVATAYMTKKNIPKVMLREMEQSRFNKYFGYVEYDEDVDIKAARTVADEFLELNKRLFYGSENFNCAIRIRKLGKHRALGVYFPQLNCMCVDIHSPDSFIHEYYHLLDDQMGLMSQQYEFYHICRKYRELVKDRIREDKGLEAALSKAGKYNLNYYFQPVEIFARCGEMYLQRIKGVKSSLLKPTLDELFAYPETDEFNEMIRIYFDSFHERLMEKGKRAA
jgi:hypothetical protein